MRVLALTRYSRLGASSRLRTYQYIPSLAEAGIRVELAPLFSDEYVRGIQESRRVPGDVASSYLRRIHAAVALARQYDLLWIEKEVLPWLPSLLDRAILPRGVPYVLDYDDAVFHYYDRHGNPLVRWLLGRKHLDLIRNSTLTIVGNEYLKDYAMRAGASAVELVPTVIDADRYGPSPQKVQELSDVAPPMIGWIGQRATARFLMPLAPVFEQITAEGLARFCAIGIDAPALGLPMSSVPWAEETEVASIGRLSVGVMPLVDEPFERGKCGYKLVQYMACALPVVASPVGVNRTIVEHGVNGFLADTPAEWSTALRVLASDPQMRQRMGAAGRAKVLHQYALQRVAPRLAGLLKEAATGKLLRS